MNIPHPWSWVPERKQGPLFLLALLLTLAVLLALQALGTPLRTDAAPAGIISYELAGTLTAAQEILHNWGPQGRTYAGLNLGLDYLFLCAYATSIGLACVLVGRRFKPGSPLHAVGLLLSWALVLAAALDALENYALIRLLLGSTGGALAALARSAALVKFLLVFLGILYAILAGLPALFFLPREKGSAA
jgi:hypothetical protein